MMLATERMRKFEVLILKRDVDEALRYLGFAGCIQLIPEGREQRELTPQERETAELKGKIESIAPFLGMGESAMTGDPPKAKLNRQELRDASDRIIAELKDLVEEESRLLKLELTLKKTIDDLTAFSHLKVDFSELEHLAYLTLRLGSVDPQRLEDLSKTLGKRALIVRLNKPGFFMAVAPKKGRWALDSELKKLDFQEAKFPEELKGIPAEALPALQARLAGVEDALGRIEDAKRKYREENGDLIRSLLHALALDASIDAVKQNLASTESVQRVTGWVPRRRFAEISSGLELITGGRMALRAYEPEELPEVRSGKTKVPVSYRHGAIVRAFERMVFSYSVPLYGTVDPTPFVTVMFVILFAIMFGDVGQGFVGLVLGLLINSGRVRSFEQYRRKNFGTVFVVVGIASMISGFLYGSFFANENALVPVSRFVTLSLLGHPMDRIVSLAGFQRIILFFGVTIGIGAVMNTVGLVINTVNTIRRRDWEKAVFSKTGIAGALFFWYVLFLAVRILFGGRFTGADLAVIAVPLLALFFREPLLHIASGKRPLLATGLFSFIMEGIVEILETAIYYVSNTISFLRVAAFALAHTVLSAIVFLLADMVGGASGGIAFKIVVILIGNAIILLLEGLIVSIQVIRLHYYEFFSKFFTDSGEKFTPFTLRASGGAT